MADRLTTEDLTKFLTANGRKMKFCFIVGSGCSVENGIPTGWELASRWYRELPSVYSSTEIERWKVQQDVSGVDFGADYGKIFKFRFEREPLAGYRAINTEIEKGQLGIGHVILSQLMLKTGSNVVITTNFDTLVEETLYTFTNSRPIICGHESVARFARPSVDHPLIIKIHRDRFMDPFNLVDEIQTLRPEWIDVLNQVFESFIPIVIGYGGNDGSLMGYLRNARPCKRLFWCVTSDRPLRQDILDVVEHHEGNIVRIESFNRLMLRMVPIFDVEAIDQLVLAKAARLSTEYTQDFLNLTNEIVRDQNGEEIQSLQEMLGTYSEDDWWYWEIRVRLAASEAEAMSLYEEGLQRIPGSADLNYFFAWKLYDLFPDRADRFLKRAVKLRPEFAEAWYLLGLIRQKKRQFKRAIPKFQKAVELSSTLLHAWSQLASSYHSIGSFDRAIECYRAVISQAPSRATTWNNLGFSYKAKGDLEEALTCFRRARSLDNLLAMPLFNMGNVYYTQGNNRRAVYYFTKATKVQPSLADAHYNLGLAYENLGEQGRARAAFRRAFALKPNDKSFKRRYDLVG